MKLVSSPVCKFSSGQDSHDLFSGYGKAFDKVQNGFMMKVLKELGLERNYLNIEKAF